MSQVLPAFRLGVGNPDPGWMENVLVTGIAGSGLPTAALDTSVTLEKAFIVQIGTSWHEALSCEHSSLVQPHMSISV